MSELTEEKIEEKKPSLYERTKERLPERLKPAFENVASDIEVRRFRAKQEKQRKKEEEENLKAIERRQKQEFAEFKIKEKYRQKQRNIEEKFERRKAQERARAGQSQLRSIGGSIFHQVDKLTGHKRPPRRKAKKGTKKTKKARGKSPKRVLSKANYQKLKRLLARLDA